MSRTTIQRATEPRGRQAISRLVMAGIGVVLVFAVIGVVSAGTFVAAKVSGGKTPTQQKHPPPAGTPVAVQDITRAQTQASAIVKSARAAGSVIVSRADARAHKQATAILADARRRAAAIAAAGSSSSSSSTAGSNGGGTSGVSGSSGAAGASGSTASAGQTGATTSPPTTVYTAPTAVPPSGAVASGGSAPAPPDLNSVPASWKVVGYNVAFGAGPGSAGSITVTNRGVKAYSGVATVVYANGGSASAPFSGLAPNQTEVLALNGPAYAGGGYQIQVNVG